MASARNTWRVLTSMRTALVLLFLLAMAALPGALLPQRPVNPTLVGDYLAQNPAWGPLLDRVGMFDVFASPWFAAVYLLLFVSLVGCLLPRTVEFARALGAAPVGTPRNLSRLPHHALATVDRSPDEVLAQVRVRLRGWRTAERDEPGEARTVAAEKGYLREAGNLVFHLSLIGLLVGMAVGKLFGYEGQVIVLAGSGQFCNTGILGYDSFRAGIRVDGTELNPFCLRVDEFTADFLNTGQPVSFRAGIGYQNAADLAGGDGDRWRPYRLQVNSPLRVDSDRVYLLGHGYAPVFTVTWPDGQRRTGVVQWKPVDIGSMLSQGATKFARPGTTADQIAVTGLFAPTSTGGNMVTSQFPDLFAPEVAVDVLRGDLGLDDGRGQSIFEVDQRKIESGDLIRVARKNLVPGEQVQLDDGTTIRFDTVQRWVSLQVSYDPGQVTVLVSALLVLLGLALSLTIKRRRIWVRLTPITGPAEADQQQLARTVVEVGGLARTDRAGYGAEFTRLRSALLEEKT